MTGDRRAEVAEADRPSPERTRRRPGRPANASSDETVAALLAAARRQFAAHGYAATSNKTVAAAAGLAHTAIYNHFGSKARLFTAVFTEVQDLLVVELQRSARGGGAEPPLPRALLDAIEALRAADPSYVEFLASMYVEVRRHPELRQIFQGSAQFPVVDILRELAAEPSSTGPDADPESSTWVWISFALGVAQLGALADGETFAATVDLLRRGSATLR
ncbi:MAG: TetR/AcrR family transcriptional regulator, partial [Acidimicrobiales bacterium]